MKTCCRAIKCLLPFSVFSLAVAIWANAVCYPFLSNVFLGLFGSGALTLISSIIGYRVERRFVLEQFYVDVRRTLRTLTQYSSSMGLDQKISFLMNFYNLEQSDIDISIGRIYFFWKNRTHLNYIYDSIYSPLCKVKGCINSHYWHFRWHQEGTGKNETVMKTFIDEIEALLFDSKEGYVGLKHCSRVERTFARSIYCELANKYYILMYGMKAYKKSGGRPMPTLDLKQITD